MKESITHAIATIIGIETAVENNEIKPYEAFAEIYAMEKALKGVKEAIQDKTINYIQDKYAKGDEPVVNGYRVLVQYRNTFSYKHDATWERFSTMLKERQTAMQKSAAVMEKHGTPYVDGNGEEVPPATKKTSSFIKMETVR
jgi:flagellar biosynthesis/type III secretory pathway protein FliH